jgi:hypothetical protein
VLAYKAHRHNIPFVLLQIFQSVCYGVGDWLIATRTVVKEFGRNYIRTTHHTYRFIRAAVFSLPLSVGASGCATKLPAVIELSNPRFFTDRQTLHFKGGGSSVFI